MKMTTEDRRRRLDLSDPARRARWMKVWAKVHEHCEAAPDLAEWWRRTLAARAMRWIAPPRCAEGDGTLEAGLVWQNYTRELSALRRKQAQNAKRHARGLPPLQTKRQKERRACWALWWEMRGRQKQRGLEDAEAARELAQWRAELAALRAA